MVQLMIMLKMLVIINCDKIIITTTLKRIKTKARLGIQISNVSTYYDSNHGSNNLGSNLGSNSNSI